MVTASRGLVLETFSLAVKVLPHVMGGSLQMPAVAENVVQSLDKVDSVLLIF